jgi:predicted dehydrogenase
MERIEAVIRAAVVGSGSAGRRHAFALRSSLPDAEIIVVRRSESGTPAAWLVDSDFRVVDTVPEAVAMRPNVAIVAGPASFHREAAEAFLASGADVLVEKPLASTVEDAGAIVAAAECARRSLVVGYHLRFSDTMPAMARMLADGAVGAVRGFHLEVGQHLSEWRSGIDPSTSVTARRELGGGVLLELSHELDAAAQLFGAIVEVDAKLGYGGAPTDGIVETIADLSLRTAADLVGHVHLDMVSAVPFRRWSVIGTTGALTADLLAGRIVGSGLDTADEEVLLDNIEPGERDRAEVRLITNLLDVSAGLAAPGCTGADGIAAVEVVDAARVSAAEGRPVAIVVHDATPTPHTEA